MHDIKSLEKEWKRYNKNKRKPFYFLVLLLGAIGGAIFFYTKQTAITINDSKKTVPLPSIIKEVPTTQKVATIKNKTNVVSKAVNESYNLLLNHSILDLELEKKEILEDKNSAGMIPTLPVVHDIPLIDDPVHKSNTKSNSKKKPLIKVQKNVHAKVKRKKKQLKILKSSTKLGLKEVARRFKRYRNVEDALFLAKTYYKQGKYLKSEYWALETNKVDSHIEESWILFAKSKIKLGQKREAMSILKKYSQQSHSKKAKKLLLKL